MRPIYGTCTEPGCYEAATVDCEACGRVRCADHIQHHVESSTRYCYSTRLFNQWRAQARTECDTDRDNNR